MMRGIAVALLLIVAGSALSQKAVQESPPSNQQTQRPAERQNDTQEPQTSAAPNPTSITAPQPVEGGDNTSPKRPEPDQDQANWLERFFYEIKITDVLLVAFTAILALYTGRLWYATAGLWDAAKEQSRDMKNSIAAARDSADAAMAAVGSERAWISFEKLECSDLGDGIIDNVAVKRGIRFHPQWKNQGRSPAINAQAYTGFKIVDIADQSIPPFCHTWGKDVGSFPFGPNIPVGVNAVALGDINRDDLINRKTAIIIYSVVRYRDIFKNNIAREVCLRVTFGGHIKNSDGTTGVRWEIRPVGPQNNAT